MRRRGGGAAGARRARTRPCTRTCARTPNSHHKIRSFRTQPLKSLSAAVKLPINKRFLGKPTLGKSIVREIIVMGTGCTCARMHVCRYTRMDAYMRARLHACFI